MWVKGIMEEGGVWGARRVGCLRGGDIRRGFTVLQEERP